MAIQCDKEIQVVANGEVYIEGPTEVITIHHTPLPLKHHRVTILEEIISTAQLPCPTEEFTYVCQATKTYVVWPTHLILPPLEKV